MPLGMTEEELDAWLDDLIEEQFKHRPPEFRQAMKMMANARVISVQETLDAMTPSELVKLDAELKDVEGA